MKKTVLRAYARLIAEVGARVQKGQDVVIEAELDQPEFVTMVADACYHAGARKVTVTWKHQALEKLAIRRESVKTLQTVEAWERAKLQHYVDTLPCRIYLLSEDPDGLNGINQEKMAKSQQRKYPIIKKYRDQIENKYQWCIAAVPGEAWAKKLFPNLRKSQAVEKLWEAILSTSRALEGDPVANWDAHNKDMHDRCAYLNGLHIRELRYKSANGTDFQVGMIPEAQFCGGCEKSLQGIVFNPNIPTEECFISPMRGKAEGIVYATKPLSYQGQLIDGFWIRFHEGKAVEWHAAQNNDLLTKLIIEKNETAISMTKILGYDNREIASLYLVSTSIVVVISDIISVVLGAKVMDIVWRIMLQTFSGWFSFHMTPVGYVKMFAFVLIGYMIVTVFDFRRIKRIPMDMALKNVE